MQKSGLYVFPQTIKEQKVVKIRERGEMFRLASER